MNINKILSMLMIMCSLTVLTITGCSLKQSDASIRLPDSSADIKMIDKTILKGYVSTEDLKTGITRLDEGITSWDKFSHAHDVSYDNYSIDDKLVIYYTITKYPSYEIHRGTLKDASIYQAWDCQTGEVIYFEVVGTQQDDW